MEKFTEFSEVQDNSFLPATLIVNGAREDFITECTLEQLITIITSKDILSEKFHIVNRNGRLKGSKMFLDKRAFIKLCSKHGQSLENHLKNIETGQVSEKDVRIMLEVYQKINKIIK